MLMSLNKKNLFKSVLVFILAICMVTTLLSIISISTVKAATSYYVATTGNDTTGDGTLGNPWKTIQRAANVMVAGDTCYIRGGTYRETVIPVNSGTAGNPITFMPYNGESVTVSGLDTVTSGWTQYSGSVYYTSVAMNMGEQNQLCINGTMGDLARWPNNTDGDLFTHNGATVDSGSITNIYDASMPQTSTDWYKGGTIWCQSNWKWACWGVEITGSGNHNINFTMPMGSPQYFDPGVTQGGDTNYYYISGKLGLLDYQNEWYYDSTFGRLYVQVPDGNPAGDSIKYKVRTLSFDLTNKNYIIVKNLTSSYASIKITGNYNTVDEVTFDHISHHSGRGMSWGHPVSTGIEVGGSNNTIKNCNIGYSAGKGIELYGTYNTIDNNTIHHIDYNGSYDAGIINRDVGSGGGNKISRNTIFACGRSCIHFGGSVPDFTSAWTVIYNDLSDAMKLTDDGAPLYTWGHDFKNTVIAYNKVHDTYGSCARLMVNGIYDDDGSVNLKLHHNIIYNIEKEALHFGANHSGLYLYNITTYNTGITMVHNRGGSYISGNLYHNAASSKFVNTAVGDFRLVSTATDAINTGTVASPYTNGYVGSYPDKGAYEYGGLNGVTNWTAGVGSTIYFSDGWPTGGATPTPTPTPTPGGLINNMVVNDTSNAADWSIRTNIQSGDLEYGDRTYTFSSVPSSVAGSNWIRTANDSKAYSGATIVSFNISANADVYVAHDDLVTTRPSWMSSWTDTGENITNSYGSTFSLYKKSYSSGTVSLGDNGQTSGCSMYTIIVKAAGATPTPTPAPGGSYTASTGFSSTQGANQWYYKLVNGGTYSDMTWDSANSRWKGTQTYCIIASSWQHPDTYDSARGWKAPQSGTVNISGSVHKISTGGDGVNVKIMKNTTQIWPASGWQFIGADDTTGVSHNLNISVVQNDMIYFVVNKVSTNAYDTTAWDPTIAY